MTGVFTTIGNIVLMLVILGILVAIHEAGHLAAAKIFKVYCFEYSIGFGPAIFKKKRKKGETAFALRAFPLGGYVSMYGEPGVVPEGFEAPDDSRSLERIPKWKKSIVLLAGVTMNFILGLILIYISACCPHYYSAYQASSSISLDANTEIPVYYLTPEFSGPVKSYIDEINNAKGDGETKFEAQDYVLLLNHQETLDGNLYGFGLCSGVRIPGESQKFVATFVPQNLVSGKDLLSSLYFYRESVEPLPEGYANVNLSKAADIAGGTYNAGNLPDGAKITSLSLTLLPIKAEAMEKDWQKAYENRLTYTFDVEFNEGKAKESGVYLPVIQQNLDFKGKWQEWSRLVPYYCGAIVKGIGSLFTGGFKDMSGIIGMTAALPSVEATGGVGYVFLYAGLISINLAFFNLLPFPGLDGWALLVTIIEGISKKKVPEKVKGIVSYVGLALLLGLMVVIAVKDIIQLIV